MSTGPRSASGRARSRLNSYKHGLTGEGLALPTEDAAEIDRRLAALEAEMKPRSAAAMQLLGRIAVLMLRLDRAALHESRAIAHRMRTAIERHDDERKSRAEHEYHWIASEPATRSRRLRSTPEGLERIEKALRDLHGDLTSARGMNWSLGHCDHLLHLMGRSYSELPIYRARALSEAMQGDFRHLGPTDGEGLDEKERKHWAAVEMVEVIEEEILAVKAMRESFDRTALELDRSEAPLRAMFDDSEQGILARKYDAANDRALIRAFREYRELQAEAEVEMEPEVEEELGSFSPGQPATGDAEVVVDPAVLKAMTEPATPFDPVEHRRKRQKLEKLEKARKAKAARRGRPEVGPEPVD